MTHILDDSFLNILARHKGAERAIPLLDLAEQMGLPRTAHGTRKVQEIKRGLCERGTMIGSSCTAGHAGYYLPETPDEMRATLHQYESRFQSLGRLIRSTKQAMGQETQTDQLGMTWDVQEPPLFLPESRTRTTPRSDRESA